MPAQVIFYPVKTFTIGEPRTALAATAGTRRLLVAISLKRCKADCSSDYLLV